jgi:hypothetical protein
LNADHDAVAVLAFLASLDETGNQRARYQMQQDRMCKTQRLQRGCRKPGGHRPQVCRHRKGDWSSTRQTGHEDVRKANVTEAHHVGSLSAAK